MPFGRNEYDVQNAQLKKDGDVYLEKERKYRELRERYEETRRKRRLAAVGLAAALLKEGEPCPVCGSRIHPCPAEVRRMWLPRKKLPFCRRRALARGYAESA